MKIAVVPPYDFAYPGGVVNHISALEHHFTRMGHQVKVIAPATKAGSSFGDRFILVGKPRPFPIAQRLLNYYTRVLSEPPRKQRLPESEAISLSV